MSEIREITKDGSGVLGVISSRHPRAIVMKYFQGNDAVRVISYGYDLNRTPLYILRLYEGSEADLRALFEELERHEPAPVGDGERGDWALDGEF